MAKAACMCCIAVPTARADAGDPRFVIAGAILDSLSALDDAVWEKVAL
jgi:hypothetical protein